MKKLLILALASAFSVVATATTSKWFEGLADGESDNASWSSPRPSGVTFTGSVIDLDLDAGDELELTPTGSAPDTATKTSVTISGAQFTPCAYESIDDSLLDGVQTALTVAYAGGNTNYYAYTGSGWETLSVTPTSSPVDVVIEMYYYTNTTGVTARFLIGGQDAGTIGLVTNNVGTVNSVSLAGNGKVASLATEVELGYASYGGRKYPSVADAVAASAANSGSGDVILHDHNGYGDNNVIAITKDQQTVLAFPRTTTPGQDGTADHPYEIADAGGLVALTNAVAQVVGARSKHYKQRANIDMASAGAFAGIGTYNANPTNGIPFTGTYDGQGYTISNVTMTARNYGGIFNQVNGGTIKNLTVENMSFPADATGEYGFGIVGNVGGDGALLQNLVAAGSFGSAEKPGTHNMAGIVVRGCGGGASGALVQDCTNNAAIYGNYTKLAGICAITQNKIEGAAITFDGCANNGALNLSRTSTGVTGLAGIVGYVSDDTVLVGCSNTGSLNNTVQGANTDCNGLLVGWAYDHVLTDNGNNSASSAAKMLAKQSPASFKDGDNKDHTCSVVGFQYATVADNVATTVTGALAKDTTYLLEGDVAASETPVFTLIALDDYIAFNETLGYTFGGAVAAGNGLVAHKAESGNVITYTAYGDDEVAEDAAKTAAQDIGISDDEAKDDLETDMKDWIASGAVTAAELDANPTNVMNRARDTGNKLTLLQSYVLNLNATNANATVKAELPAGGTQTVGTGAGTKILIKVPVTPRENTGYTVKYQVMRKSDNAWVAEGEAQTDPNEIKIPVGTGRYRVDAVLQKN